MPADRVQTFVPRSSVRSFAYHALLAMARACYKAGNGALFTATGLLRRDELQAASVEQWRRFNLAAGDVDAGLTPAEAEFYGRFIPANARILLIGCGTGRDILGLEALGHDVIGLEPGSDLVELARQHLARHRSAAVIRTGLVQSADLGGPYDVAIFSNGCYSFLQGTAVRVAALQRVAAHVFPHGRIIVSYHSTTHQSAIGRWLTRTAARVSGADWTPEDGDTFWRDSAVAALIRYHHVFAPREFATECERAGLHLLIEDPSRDWQWFAAAERPTRQDRAESPHVPLAAC
jgi:SAM-dependent methyltransferase